MWPGWLGLVRAEQLAEDLDGLNQAGAKESREQVVSIPLVGSARLLEEVLGPVLRLLDRASLRGHRDPFNAA
jgi:hypothetical protein